MLKSKKEKRIIFRLDLELKEKFLKICEDVQVNPAVILREMVRNFVDEYQQQDCSRNRSSLNSNSDNILKQEIKSLQKKVNSLQRRLYRQFPNKN